MSTSLIFWSGGVREGHPWSGCAKVRAWQRCSCPSHLWAALPAQLLLAVHRLGGKKNLWRDGETPQCFQVSEVWKCYNDHFDGNWIPASSEIWERVLTPTGCPNSNPPTIFCFLQNPGSQGVCVLTPESIAQKTVVSARKSSKSVTKTLNFTPKEYEWKSCTWNIKFSCYQNSTKLSYFGRRFKANSLETCSKLSAFYSHIINVRLRFPHGQTVLGFTWN